MDSKNEPLVERFLETHNMDYVFCLLAGLESERLNSLPDRVKNDFGNKVTSMAMSHVAKNDIPDYIIDIPEEEQEYYYYDDDDEYDEEEYVDDSKKSPFKDEIIEEDEDEDEEEEFDDSDE